MIRLRHCAFALALLAGPAAAMPGYLTTARDDVVRSGAGLCWHTFSWRPALAVERCDPKAKAPRAVGYADRIGEEDYNLELSERRAEAVRDYLADLGIELKLISAEGRGEGAPVTGDACHGRRGDALVACLQPDRRVELEARGYRKEVSRE